jgi:hypothetical protein
VGTFLLNLSATSRPIQPLTLSAKYRLYDYNDMSDEPIFPAHEINDRGAIVIEPRLANRFDYTRQNLDLDARWRFGRPVALTVGAGWENWDRNSHREVKHSDEVFGKIALDATPSEWLLARLTYRPSLRRNESYNTNAHHAHSVLQDEGALDLAGQSLLLRKYDEGARNRQQVDLLVQLTLNEAFTTSLSAGYRDDDYIYSRFGLQEANAWTAGIDFTWTPLERIAFTGGYVYEWDYKRQRSRNRNTAAGVALDFRDFDWISHNVDTIHTFHLGGTLALIPGVLDWAFNGNYSAATGEILTRNPGPLTSGTLANQVQAAGKRMPALEDSLIRLDTTLKYHFWKAWTANFGYIFESFAKHDWRTDDLQPFTPGITSIWLGNDVKNYSAHIVALTVGYRFK